jgi:hypothetical protein
MLRRLRLLFRTTDHAWSDGRLSDRRFLVLGAQLRERIYSAAADAGCLQSIIQARYRVRFSFKCNTQVRRGIQVRRYKRYKRQEREGIDTTTIDVRHNNTHNSKYSQHQHSPNNRSLKRVIVSNRVGEEMEGSMSRKNVSGIQK